MQDNNLRSELKQTSTRLLTTKCVYKYTNRSGWIVGFGNGLIAYIEDHRNKLEIETWLYVSDTLIDFIERIIWSHGNSSEKIDDYITVEECNSYDMPDPVLIKLAKNKLWFGFNKASECNFTCSDIDESIEEYYEKRNIRHSKLFPIKIQ